MRSLGSRREEVLMHARRVIMRDGLEATSLRRIAREGGFTTGVLTHYFADKSDLISACFEWTMRTWLDRVEREIRDAPTAEESVCRFVAVAVPHAPERHGEWRLWLNFVGTGAGDKEMATLLVDTDQRWETLVTETLTRWHEAGLVSPRLPDELEALILARLGDGLGLRALMTGDWDDARRTLVAALGAIGLPDDLARRALAPPTVRSQDQVETETEEVG
jgi:AcrR family transcriptional regulator